MFYLFLTSLKKVLSSKSETLYKPVLTRRAKAEKMRLTLTFLEQWKFFFQLPRSLRKSIERQEYDVAVRDFKKGKYLISSSKGSKSNAETDALLPVTHLRTFETVWKEVELIADDLRNALFKQLTAPSQSLEMQEKIIGYILFSLTMKILTQNEKSTSRSGLA